MTLCLVVLPPLQRWRPRLHSWNNTWQVYCCVFGIVLCEQYYFSLSYGVYDRELPLVLYVLGGKGLSV